MREAPIQSRPPPPEPTIIQPTAGRKSFAVIRIVNSANQQGSQNPRDRDRRVEGKYQEGRTGRKEPMDQHGEEEEKKCKRGRERREREKLESAVPLKANEAFKGSEENKSAE